MSIPKEFLRTSRIRAICVIRNLKTERSYLYKTEDAVKSYSDERFKLDLGMHPNRELQREYTSLGLELFQIEIETEAGEEDDLESLLEERKNFFLTKGKKLY